MGKKKKKRKKKKVLIPPESLSVLIGNIKFMVEQKRGRHAITLAKFLVKHKEFQRQKHLPIFIAAYQVRITEMLDVLHLKEAKTLYTDIVEKYSDSADLFSIDFLVKMDMESDSAVVLSNYGHDNKVTLAVNQYIINELKDIRTLLKNTALPCRMHLKTDAELIITAWKEIEDKSGKITSYELMLKKINRRSPFIYWRLFIQALNMFYKFKDESALNILSRIPHDCSIYKMASTLTMLINNQPMATAKELNIEYILQGANLYSEIAGIDRMIDAKKWSDADAALETIISANIHGRQSGLFIEFGSLFLRKIPDFSNSICKCLSKKSYYIYMIIHASHLYEPDIELDSLKKILSIPSTRLCKIEKALLHKRIGDLSLMLSDSEFHQMDYSIPKFMLENLGIDTDTDKNFVDTITASYNESIQHHPLPETYKKWYQVCQDFNVKIRESEQVLKQWQETFPDDEQPLLEQVKACRFRKAFVKAITNFRKLEKIAKGHPEVEKLRPYLLLDLILRSFKENQPQKAQTFIRDCAMLNNKSVFVHTALKTFEFILAVNQSSEKSSTFEKNLQQLAELNQPVIIRSIIAYILDKVTSCMTLKIPKLINKQEKDINLVLESLYQFSIINDELWKKQLKNYILLVTPDKPAETLNVTSYKLLTCIIFLQKKDKYFENKNMLLFYWIITAGGIEANNELTYLFLAYRGLLYDIYLYTSITYKQELELEKYEEDCYEAACQLARNSTDHSACEKLDAILNLSEAYVEDYNSNYSEKFIKSVINRELKRKTKFSFLKKTKKKTPSKPKPIQLKLF